MKFSFGRMVFNCPLFLIIVYLLLLVLLLNLGFWQLNRANEKRELIAKQTQSRMLAPLSLLATTEDSVDNLRYRKVIAHGYYDVKQQFLLDNQIVNGKAGYFVLTPFILQNSKKAVLVNRGWVAANLNRQILPDVSFKKLPTILSGRINQFPSVGIKLAGTEIPTKTTPAVVQVVNTQVLAKNLKYALFSFQVELDANTAEGYTRLWQTTTLMPPERHFGYAMQWFGLALTLTFLFFWYSSKNTHDD
jgi:surfeit locus 1 family protein